MPFSSFSSDALVAATVLACGLLLAGCGRQAPAGGDAAATQRQVVDALGAHVAVPARPKRVVVLSELDLDAALALGLRPVGSTSGRGQAGLPDYLARLAAGVEPVGRFAEPSMERVLALEPDLILAGGNPEPQQLAQLAQIAPTVVSFKPGEGWQDSLRRIAVVLGREPQAEAVLAAYRQRVDALRQRLDGRPGEQASIARWTPQGPVYMLGDAFAGRVLADLGFGRPLLQRAPGAGHSAPLSREALADIDGDWLFIGRFASGSHADPAGLAALLEQPEFRELRAVRAGQVREVDAALWTSVGGPLAAQALIEQIGELLVAKGAPVATPYL